MNRASVICCFALLVASLIPSSLGCGEDCPGDCENKYQCVDRSEICEKMKHECENFFFRKCMRCACPKTCGVCSNGSSEEETTSTTQNTTTVTMSTTSTSTPSYTEEPVTEEPSTEEPSSSSPSSEEPPSSSSTPEPSTSVEPTTPPEVPSSTVEEISDAEFSDPTKMKCKSCDAKRKKLAEIYDKYYPK